MNTLNLDFLIGLLFLSLSVTIALFGVRGRPWQTAPRLLMRAAITVAYGWIAIITVGKVVYDINHPADIHPLTAIYPSWVVWGLYAVIASIPPWYPHSVW